MSPAHVPDLLDFLDGFENDVVSNTAQTTSLSSGLSLVNSNAALSNQYADISYTTPTSTTVPAGTTFTQIALFQAPPPSLTHAKTVSVAGWQVGTTFIELPNLALWGVAVAISLSDDGGGAVFWELELRLDGQPLNPTVRTPFNIRNGTDPNNGTVIARIEGGGNPGIGRLQFWARHDQGTSRDVILVGQHWAINWRDQVSP